MLYFPIIGSFLEAVGTVLQKKILKGKAINYKNYSVFEFFFIVLLSIPFVYFMWGIERDAFLLRNVLIFASIVVVSVAANLAIAYSLKREDITEFEPIWLMQPLFTILLAFIFFENERNWNILTLSLIASLSLIFSHIKKSHLVFDRYSIAALIGSFLFALELVLSNFILDFYSPFVFYFLRCLFIFLIIFLVFRPSFKILKNKAGWLFALIGLVWIFYRVIIYYGYTNIGVVYTTLLFILSGVFIFLFAIAFLKEKPKARQIVSAVIIVICVALSWFIRK